MLKYAIVIAHMFGFFALGTFLDDGVIIEDNTPSSLQPGEEQTVEITINKGEVEGFAKLQLELPDGLIATAGETKGASFTFSNQKVKFIWMSLPDNQEFTVSYKVQALPTASGSKVITGTFSYIKENQRVDYNMQSKMVEITETTTVIDSEQPSTGVEAEGLACVRTTTDLGNGNYLIKLDVVNSELSGFAKIKEILPPGSTISEEDSDGAVVTIESNSIKFIWFDVPTESAFSVAYRVRNVSTTPSIDGTFSFVEDNAPREAEVIDNGLISAEENLADNGIVTDEVDEMVATTTETPETDGTRDTTDNAISDQTEIEGASQDQIATHTTHTGEASTTETTDASTTVPDPDQGVSYRVQIAAAHRVVGASYFKSRHGFNEQFDIENHEGWVKYTTGSYSVYKGARDDRERIKNRYNFRGPFVTAYNDGVRITVQEALMITKQKWYK